MKSKAYWLEMMGLPTRDRWWWIRRFINWECSWQIFPLSASYQHRFIDWYILDHNYYLATLNDQKYRRFIIYDYIEHDNFCCKIGSFDMCGMVRTVWHALCDVCHVTCGMWYVSCGTRMQCDVWYVLCGVCRVTCVIFRVTVWRMR